MKMMTNEEAIRIATGLRTDFKCESDTMVDFCNTVIKALGQTPRKDEIILTKKEYGELVSSEFDNGYAKGYREALEQQPTVPANLLDKLKQAREEIENLNLNDYGDNLYQFQAKCSEILSKLIESEDK